MFSNVNVVGAIVASSPTDAQDALLAVEATGRDAMTELRNLLGLLSPAADGRDAGASGVMPVDGVLVTLKPTFVPWAVTWDW